MQDPERKLGGDRQSIWSISKSEQATSSASPQRIFFAGLAFLAYHETLVLKTGESATVIIAQTGVTGAAAAVLSLATAEGGRLAMVAARYIEERYLNPLRAKRIKREQEAKKRIREEARAEVKAEVKAEVTAEVKAEVTAENNARWGAWNERRLAAEAKGEPFDEPTPATLRIETGGRRRLARTTRHPAGLRRPPRQAPRCGCGARRTPSIVNPTDQRPLHGDP